MKITIYTTTNCQFSKQEKDYLISKSVAFEEKNLDTNKAFLTEMMTVGNNFAGTPVTKIEKDDGSIVVLKGFTQDEFDVALGFAPETKPDDAAPVAETPAPAVEEAKTPAVPPQPPVETMPTTPPQETISQPTAPAMPPVAEKPTEPPLNDVLSQLEDQMKDVKPQEPAPTAIPTVESPAQSAPAAPTMPPAADSAPAIPDFPADTAAQPAK